MSNTILMLLVLAAVVLAGGALTLMRRRRAAKRHGVTVEIVDPDGPPRWEDAGDAHSVQAAEITMPLAALEQLWSATALERLARTYWRFLSRVTCGAIRVVYSPSGRAVVLLARPIVLLGFDPPEYELDAERGLVRWRIRRGLLVSRRGRDGKGSLKIEVRRMESPGPELGRIHVEIAVLSFYPAIASSLGRWIYGATQSRIHVIVTHSFLRSLARLDLAESRTGRFTVPEDPERLAS
ncbi:MAG: hypothetical protein NVSMB51_05450 [Solirubrobacteraceae bacterium]